MNEINQKWKIGDCRDLMQNLESDSIDLIATDPPYGYSFMGKDWDKVVPPTELWKECLRILKPGAFAFIMSAPRQDVLAHNLVNLSDAGFETGFTSIYWTYSSGFPKSGNIGKMVDKRLGAEREIISGESKPSEYSGKFDNRTSSTRPKDTGAITPQAKELDGSYSGFQPKPAVEVIMVVMKPLSEKTYVDQAMTNQKGVSWLDDGRIPYQSGSDKDSAMPGTTPMTEINSILGNKIRTPHNPQNGRFPANLLVCDDVLNDGNITSSVESEINNKPSNANTQVYGFKDYKNMHTSGKHYGDSGTFSRYFDLDAWWIEQIKQLPKEPQSTFPFLITPKASKSEKGDNCNHPTVKPVKLISWLITIGSRKNDLILDPFLGSGTTLEAGRFTGRRVLGFEISDEWEHLYPNRCMAHQPPLSNYV